MYNNVESWLCCEAHESCGGNYIFGSIWDFALSQTRIYVQYRRHSTSFRAGLEQKNGGSCVVRKLVDSDFVLRRCYVLR